MKNIRKGRLVLLFWIFFIPYVVTGGGMHGLKTGVVYLVLFLFGCFIFYTIIDFFFDVGHFLSRFGGNTTNIHIHGQPADEIHPDIEGTARRHPDPTRPDDEEWLGAITYRLETRRHK